MTYCVVIVPAGIGEVSIDRYSILELNTDGLGTLNQHMKFSQSDFKCWKMYLLHHGADEQCRSPKELLIYFPGSSVLHKPAR